MLNSENTLLMIYKQLKMYYVMQERNILGLLKESKIFLNTQLLNYNNNFGFQINNWFLLRKLFRMDI